MISFSYFFFFSFFYIHARTAFLNTSTTPFPRGDLLRMYIQLRRIFPFDYNIHTLLTLQPKPVSSLKTPRESVFISEMNFTEKRLIIIPHIRSGNFIHRTDSTLLNISSFSYSLYIYISFRVASIETCEKKNA